ncbi:hypothetical protein [Neobacillus vireti]
MTNSVKLTQQRLREILLYTYLRVMKDEKIKVEEVIEEIKQQFLSVRN